MGRKKHLFLSILLKLQIFILLKLGGGVKLGLINFLLKLSKYFYIFNSLF